MADQPTPSESEDDSPGIRPSRFVWLIVLGILGIVVAMAIMQNPPGSKKVGYSELKELIRKDKVERIVIHDDARIDATPKDAELEANKKDSKAEPFTYWRTTRLPLEDDTFVPLLDSKGIEYRVETGCGEGTMMVLWLLPLLLLLFFWNTILRRFSGSGASPAVDFGRSRAKMYVEEGTGVNFDDVSGCDEAKQELQEVVDFLSEPEEISRLGGQVPKGVLLIGPPGTGKTLLARAVAGEAKVPFFNLSGSDFVEMFVGVGAARVRDLFQQAQQHAPCIIFVDELDAIGKSRAGSQIQSNDEREQTLNALLVEMDGFDGRSGVILLAATNRPEVLDQALLRPGRFDRQVLVDRPDVVGREAILKTHARKIIMDPELDLHTIAAQTPGFVGADLANIVNEAALLAARLGKDAVELEDFQESIERVIAGLEKKSRRLSVKEKNIVAYHETGHALVAAAVKTGDPVHKVSIVSRGMAALGYTLQVPVEDRYLMTRAELRDRICVLLGGRAAEDIIFGDISTGASNDLERTTGIARAMVSEYGMSARLGHVNYTERGDQFLGDAFTKRLYSDRTAEAIDTEVHELIETLYARTVAILEHNVDLLHEMSERLKEVEVLDGEELKSVLDLVKPVHADDALLPSRDGSLP